MEIGDMLMRIREVYGLDVADLLTAICSKSSGDRTNTRLTAAEADWLNRRADPECDGAIIAVEKLTAYLLNPSHKRGGAKARLLISLGYRTRTPEILDSDLRQHLSFDATRTSQNPYGIAYEIEGAIATPIGRTVRFCSIWQIDTGSELPRFNTMYPR